MASLLRHQALLALMAVVIFFTNLGSFALFNEDETKNATCGAEMFRRGDWIVPTFNESLRTDKPILLYWLMLTAYKLFGISEFSARFSSSLLSVGTTLLTYHLGRKLYSAEVGLLSSCILATCLLFSGVGRGATPDATLIFFVTLAFTSYVWVIARQRGGNFTGFGLQTYPTAAPAAPSTDAMAGSTGTAEEPGEVTTPSPIADLFPRDWKLASPIYVAMGLAVLAKGPVGVVLPLGILILFLLTSWRAVDLERQAIPVPEGPWWRRWWRTAVQTLRPRPVLEVLRGLSLPIGIGLVLAVALPWYALVGFMTKGEWLQGFFLDHNIGRALSAKENHTGFPFYYLYYVVAIHLSCFPWSVFLPVATFRLWERLTEGALWRDSDRLVACWAGVWFVFFSLASTKLPNYLLPMYPAVALILGRFFFDWRRADVDEGVYSFNICCRVLGFVGILMVIGVYIAAYVLFPNDQWMGLVGLIPIVAAYLSIKFLDREQRLRVIQTLIAASFLLALMVVAIGPARVTEYQDSPKLLNEVRKFAGGDQFKIGTYGYFQPSVVFYAGRKVEVLQSPRQVADFLTSDPNAFVITKAALHNELRDELMGDIGELSRHRNFLRRTELILIGHQR